MTQAEYKEVKNAESSKWLACINFITAFIFIVQIIVKIIEQKSIIVSIICAFYWLICGIVKIIEYKHRTDIIKIFYIKEGRS